jgi:beta-lactamase regulating signal transducer with metallopeptidase domain
VAGLRRPRVIVSAGALTTLDDDELAASLDHEHGHIARRHRFLFVFAELCRGLARFLPGTGRATRELAFHLERDADQWALARRHDPYALASAICKAATARPGQAPALTSLGGSGVTERLRQLLDGTAERSRMLTSTALSTAAVAMVAFTLALLALLPATTLAGVQQLGQRDQVRHCGD